MKKNEVRIYPILIIILGLFLFGAVSAEAKGIKPKIKNIYYSNGSMGKVYVVSFCGLQKAAGKVANINVKAKIKGGSKNIFGLAASLGQNGCGAVDVKVSGAKSFKMQAQIDGKWSAWSKKKKSTK